MTQEDIEQVIKDQPELWVTSEENPKEKKEKEKDKGKKKENEPAKDKEEAKEKDKGKAPLAEKRPRTTDTRNSSRKKRRSVKPTYHAVLHEDEFEAIDHRNYNHARGTEVVY
jgi:hypothetical protein